MGSRVGKTKTKESVKTKKTSSSSPLGEIQRLYAVMSARVIGQEEAKRTIASAIAIHKDRLLSNLPFVKSNVLIYGPTGSGKTEMIRSIVSDLKCPFVIVDASKITPSGFVGEDPSAFIRELLDKAGGDPKIAETGIVMIDEIDKLATTQSSHEGTFQLRKVQAELLKLIEGTRISVKVGSDLIPGTSRHTEVDTTKILFIAAGAFHGMDEQFNVVEERTIGFVQKEQLSTKRLEPSPAEFVQALCKYGIMPELAGRFQLKTKTRKLEKEDYAAILRDQNISSTSNYYIEMLKSENIDLSLSEEFIQSVATSAMEMGLGVRGIQGIVEARMVELLFDINQMKGKKVILEPEGYRFEGSLEANREINQIMQALATSSFLQSLDRKVLSYFCGHGKLITATSGDKVMREGDDPKSVMVLLSGSVMATNSSGLNIRRDEIGSLFGEIGFLNGSKRTATLTAENECRLLELSSDSLDILIKERPVMGVEIMKALTRVAMSRR